MKRKIWYFSDSGEEKSKLIEEDILFAIIDDKKLVVVE